MKLFAFPLLFGGLYRIPQRVTVNSSLFDNSLSLSVLPQISITNEKGLELETDDASHRLTERPKIDFQTYYNSRLTFSVAF